ncbi:MAG: hypothetical protein RR092_01535 [Oscillospiraceae bacterium]
MSTATATARQASYGGGATYGDLAYDLDSLAREHTLRHAGDETKPVAQPKLRTLTKSNVREKQHVSVLAAVGFVTVVGLAICLLMSYIQLTTLSADVVSLKADLTQSQTENTSLKTRYEQTFDLAAVKTAATAAGMSKPSSSQIYYINLSGADQAVVYQERSSGVMNRLLTSLNHGVLAVVEYFD